MKRGRLQCKDIPDGPILLAVARMPSRLVAGKMYREWCCRWDLEKLACFHGVDQRLMLAKMASLLDRGYVTGCACGCSGQFELTPKGEAYVAEHLEQVT